MDNGKIYEFFKNKNNKALYIILLIGVAIMLFAGFDGGDKEEVRNVQAEAGTIDDEERLSAILSDIKGAGAVSVMITYYESEQKDLAYEIRESENVSASSTGHERTVDKQAVMAEDGPMVVKEVYPDVKGVIVTAEGAGDIKVKESISTAVQAVMNVPAHRVCVYEKSN